MTRKRKLQIQYKLNEEKIDKFLKQFATTDRIKYIIADDAYNALLKMLLHTKSVDIKDQSWLFIAARFKAAQNLELLLNFGSDVNACDDKGNNALHYAMSSSSAAFRPDSSQKGDKDPPNIGKIITVLQNNKCEEVPNNNGTTPADLARYYGYKVATVRLKKHKSKDASNKAITDTISELTPQRSLVPAELGDIKLKHLDLIQEFMSLYKQNPKQASSQLIEGSKELNKEFMALHHDDPIAASDAAIKYMEATSGKDTHHSKFTPLIKAADDMLKQTINGHIEQQYSHASENPRIDERLIVRQLMDAINQYPKVIKAVHDRDLKSLAQELIVIQGEIKSDKETEDAQRGFKVDCALQLLIAVNNLYEQNTELEDFIINNINTATSNLQPFLYFLMFQNLALRADEDSVFEKINDVYGKVADWSLQYGAKFSNSKNLVEHISQLMALLRAERQKKEQLVESNEQEVALTEEENLTLATHIAENTSKDNESESEADETSELGDYYIDPKKFAKFIKERKEALSCHTITEILQDKSWKIDDKSYSTQDDNIVAISRSPFYAFIDREKISKTYENAKILLNKSTTALSNGMIPVTSHDRSGVKFLKEKGLYEIKVDDDDRICAKTVYVYKNPQDQYPQDQYLVMFDHILSHKKIDSLPHSPINIVPVGNSDITPTYNHTTKIWEEQFNILGESS
jgi:ankyrin repeat protein